MDAPHPRVSVEPPDQAWGTVRILLTQLQKLGYDVDQHIILGKSLLVIK